MLSSGRTATVHIGTEKTGTTTIQEFLYMNREALAEQGIAVPDFLGIPSHHWLPAIAGGAPVMDDFLARLGLMDGPSRDRAVRVQALQLREWARAVTRPHLILTSEHLSSRLVSHESVSALAAVLQGIADSVRIVVYLREPITAAVSYWSTQVRAGQVVRSLGSPSEYAWLCDYRALLSRWESAFPGCLDVRLFGRGDLHGDGLVADFCEAAGIDLREDMRIPGPLNSSLSWPALKVLAAVNAKFPGFTEDGTVNPARGRLDAHFDGYRDSGPVYRPSSGEVEAFHAYYAGSNEWVRRRYFADPSRLWSAPCVPRTPAEDADFDARLTPEEVETARLVCSIWGAGSPDRHADPEAMRQSRRSGSGFSWMAD